ncbi:MAG: DUF932 domain-containing protein [Candidatus Poribacteria bacterium]|nr:DUF932 domain-containing protein [Candidatus Poribacteria bacterium]
MPRITEFESLMFPVELRPVYTNIEIDGTQLQKKIPNSRVIVNIESGKPLGVVSKDYKLITNKEAVEMGKQCCAELFGSNGAANIKVFRVDAPSTASYCHIDLVHRGYVMNLLGGEEQSDIYIPYVRVTNSYNKSRALRFDIGFCREICFNGAIFGAETVTFVYNHTKHQLNNSVRFNLQKEKVGKLIEDFESHINKLKNYDIPRAQAFDLLRFLFKIEDEHEINFESEKEDRGEYEALLGILDQKLSKYIDELGENGYALFNAVTDIASHTIDKNRYFRRHEIHAMQRLAGNWINSFQTEIERPDFDIDSYLDSMRGDPPVQGVLF